MTMAQRHEKAKKINSLLVLIIRAHSVDYTTPLGGYVHMVGQEAELRSCRGEVGGLTKRLTRHMVTFKKKENMVYPNSPASLTNGIIQI